MIVKSVEESARERRNYVEQARAAFHSNEPVYTSAASQEEQPALGGSMLGVRIVIAAFLFACFVYFEQEKISFRGIGTQEIVQQIEWNPLPTEEWEDLLGDISVSKGR